MKIFRTSTNIFFLFLWVVMLTSTLSMAQTSTLVYMSGGRLQYKADARGNIIPDFSYVGYHQGEKEIPIVPIVKTISADTGDNLAKIQNAINEVGALTPDANGIRGAILLKAGTYKVSNSINLNKSGVILRGEGNSTHIIATRREQHSLIVVSGSGGPVFDNASRKQITDSYVPIGARTVTVEAGHTFKVGDRIILERKPNQDWIKLLGMDKLHGTVWTPEAYTFQFKRMIVAINGNNITIDAPVVDPIDPKYAQGFLYKYSWDKKVENCGVENIYLDSEFSSSSDENHGWTAVQFSNTENSWMQNVEVHHFGYSAAYMQDGSYKITVLNCKFLEPISQTIGGRKYSFNIGGQQCLVKNCYTNSGRHDYVLDARTPGPNAFVNCKADNQKDESGPHQRWAVGCLYDNITGNRELNVMNRLNSGTGHGWDGSQIMLWNCHFAKHTLQDPPADHINWAIGCTAATITGNGRYTTEPIGFVESQGTNVLPQSLYEQQLKDRLSNSTVNNAPTVSITSPANNASFTSPASVTINANASDSDGSVAKVEFFNGTTKLGEDATSPYSFAWNNVAAGTYALTAKATDDKGATNSVTVTVTVTTALNKAPTVSVTSPANNSSFTAPAAITINANASDSDGSVTKVEFFNGSTKLGEDAISPYSFTWNNVAAGSYSLTAKATDDKGAITTSVVVSVTVKANTDACSGLPTYVENGGYAAGSKVKNAGAIYQCKPYPYNGWCNGAAWAYAPGTGSYWSDAWDKVGTCNGARAGVSAVDENNYDAIVSPNPAEEFLKIETSNISDVEIIDSHGKVLKNIHSYNSGVTINISDLTPGLYLIRIYANDQSIVKTFVKK